MKKILVVGVGSVVRGDDAVGVKIIEALYRTPVSQKADLHSGDISGMDLLKHFPGHGKVVIIDAARMGLKPGEIRVFGADSIQNVDFEDKVSTHGIALGQTLKLAGELDLECDIKIVGIEPEDTSYRLDMTSRLKETVSEAVEVVSKIVEEENRCLNSKE